MFTGISEEVGQVLLISGNLESKNLVISADKVLKNTIVGDSISINGVCQTVVSISKNSFSVNVLKVSLLKSNLNYLKKLSKVNLERAVTPNRPLGGHIVQGHVQEVGVVSKIIKSSNNIFLHIRVSDELLKFMINEGSVTIDGLSLTISQVIGSVIIINIIPHTWNSTITQFYKVGSKVNIEPDILIKTYISQTLSTKNSGLTKDKLLGWGY